MPVLKANGEAEALCAQLNNEGHVQACITSDSDAFLFGAECVIKCIRPNSKVSIVSCRLSCFILACSTLTYKLQHKFFLQLCVEIRMAFCVYFFFSLC